MSINNLPMERVRARLEQLEDDENVRVIYACESGSRAWGFASANSDYDVRGIFLRPKARYLELDGAPDNYEFIEGDLDFQLWDIYKFLKLERKSNPSAFEWMTSHRLYVAPPTILRQHWWRMELEHWWNRQALIHHYRGIVVGHYHKYIKNQEVISLKKYLYILRPLTMMQWLLHQDELPHHDFMTTLVLMSWDNPDWMSEEVRARIVAKTVAKRQGLETTLELPDPLINEFIEQELVRWQENRPEWDRPSEFEEVTYRLDIMSLLRMLLEHTAPEYNPSGFSLASWNRDTLLG